MSPGSTTPVVKLNRKSDLCSCVYSNPTLINLSLKTVDALAPKSALLKSVLTAAYQVNLSVYVWAISILLIQTFKRV